MAFRPARYALVVIALAPLTASAARGEMLYFKNRRTLEALSHEVKGKFIYVTMTNGKTVFLPADSVDWEGTERLKSAAWRLEPTSYEEEEADAESLGPARSITGADLKKGTGFRLHRAAAPSMVVDVAADAVWVDSRINVKAGQTVSLRASGKVTLGPGLDAGPEGISPAPAGSRMWLDNQPFGCLLVRVGLAGDPAVVLGSARLVMPADGRLFLGVNDKTPEDNAGSLSVRIDLPAPKSSAGATGAAPYVSSPEGAGSAGAGTGSAPPPQKGFVGGVDRAKAARGAANAHGAATAGAARDAH